MAETIKIILCYDDYFNPNILPIVFTEKDLKVKNDNRYFLVNIMEIEMLFSLYAKDENLFNNVIKDMLRRNISDSGEGVSLLNIFRDNGFYGNSFWLAPIFDEYKNLLKKIVKKHKKFFE